METFIIILIFFVIASVIERYVPRRSFKGVSNGWLVRALSVNMFQLGFMILGNVIWDPALERSESRLIRLPYSPFVNGLIAYVINTWIFYWWHRGRHEIEVLWRWCHQLHHSPVRIEVITAFYKHPVEVMLNAVIITVLVYPILGLDYRSNQWFIIFSVLSEFFYHINISTPHWLGYIIQRPESHQIHHLEDRIYCQNYADLPIWDLLGGTFNNPCKDTCPTGFSSNRETKMYELLTGRNLVGKSKPIRIIPILVLVIGSLSTVGLMTQSSNLKNIGFVTGASPLPLVFSAYNGLETFSTELVLTGTCINGTVITVPITNRLYGQISGPYNRRNMYGVVFSHGPAFTDPDLIARRDAILYHGFCRGALLQELGYNMTFRSIVIDVRSKTVGSEQKRWRMEIDC
jgi:sterol desaturase/sphingolipid hydroxylase (fatty acid hydroxylase superfamily)